jgi:hypothetical protein
MPGPMDMYRAGYAIHREVLMKATIDRIEGKLAVLLIRDGESIKLNVPLILLPEGSKEGDILDISIQKDEKEAEDAKKRVSGLIEKLMSKSEPEKK